MTPSEPNRADLGKEPSRVSGMFDQVAAGYDRTNTVMTVGNDALWRAATTRAVAPKKGERILDLGAGTASSSASLARSGAEVHAVSHGRVAYADWLKGYGLLLILDHGDGYMSLYGYNDTLLRDVGDWVNAGDIVATAGTSGGHKAPALYFELRQRGKPLDPRGWLRGEK